MENSWRDLFIAIVIDGFIFKNNEITLSALIHLHTQVVGLHKTGIGFYCEVRIDIAVLL